jgi:S1-C subfamily serine protease
MQKAKTSTRVMMGAALASLALVAVEPGLMGSSLAASAPRATELRACLAEMERSVVDLFERASMSVVQIAAFSGVDDAATFTSKIGSGFVWDAAGNILTNEHVVRGASMIVVWLASGERAEAEAVGAAPNHDLAVIRLKEKTRVLPQPIPIGNSKDLKVGQFAYAIGSPFGLDQSLTTGVISALKRQLPTDNGGAITQVIQTDAAIYPGNSGGPLLDSAGRLIGVNTISYALTGSHAALGFAIPVELAQRIVPELVNNGRVSTPGIGIVAADETTAARLRIDGVIIARIESGSPAERAGLEASNLPSGRHGDIIAAANGRPVRNAFDLNYLIDELGVGRQIELTVDRNGARMRIDVEIVDVDRNREPERQHRGGSK